jgi:hypothetical protein
VGGIRLIESRRSRNVSRPVDPSFPSAQPGRAASGSKAPAGDGRLRHGRSWIRDGQTEDGHQRLLPRTTARQRRNHDARPSCGSARNVCSLRRSLRVTPSHVAIFEPFSLAGRSLEPPVFGKISFRGRPPHPCRPLLARNLTPWPVSLCSGIVQQKFSPGPPPHAANRVGPPGIAGHSSRSLRGKIPEPPGKRGC